MISELELLIRERLKKKRVEHSIRVAKVAVDLAKHYGVDTQKAYLAGLLHDFSKDQDEKELLEIADRENLIKDSCEYQALHLLHGPVAAWQLRNDDIITDVDVLNAIASHTVGHPQMSLLEKIIFIADYIEPGRKTPGVEKIRKISYDNLDAAILACLNNTFDWLLKMQNVIHPDAIRLRNELLAQQTKKGVHA